MAIIPEGEFKDHGGPISPRRPWWFTVLLILLVIPGFLTPWFLAKAVEMEQYTDTLLPDLLKWMPVYLVASAVCAWLCYPARRPLAWILVVLMLLSTAALFLV